MQTVPTLASTRWRNVSSLSTLPLTRRVEPNATSVLVSSFNSFGTLPPVRRARTSGPPACAWLILMRLRPPALYRPCDARVRPGLRPAPGLSYELAPVFVLVDLAADGLAVFGRDDLGHRSGARD